MKKLLLAAALVALAACGGPLAIYKNGAQMDVICVRDCEVDSKGEMVCITHEGAKFGIPHEYAATYRNEWRLGSCSCHYHFPDVKE